MTDMVVDLYRERQWNECPSGAAEIQIKRALVIDKQLICDFVREHFIDHSEGWIEECAATLYRHPTTCLIAVRHREIVGFACYDGTAKGMVGPMGVAQAYRNKGIATAMLNAAFNAMKADGYAYAIIGWVGSVEFYEKACGAIALPDNFPGIYSRMLAHH